MNARISDPPPWPPTPSRIPVIGRVVDGWRRWRGDDLVGWCMHVVMGQALRDALADDIAEDRTEVDR